MHRLSFYKVLIWVREDESLKAMVMWEATAAEKTQAFMNNLDEALKQNKFSCREESAGLMVRFSDNICLEPTQNVIVFGYYL